MYGFGTLYKTDPSSGNVIDCDSWQNLFQSVCWNPTAPTVVPAQPIVNADGTVSNTLVPATSAGIACTSSLISGICDSTVYMGIAVVGAAFVFFIFMGGKR